MHTSFGTYDCVPAMAMIQTKTLRTSTFVAQILDAGPSPTAFDFRLDPARPNPFETATTFAYALPRAGRVRLEIVDPRGRRIATLVDETRPAGRHVAMWQGRAGAGQLVPAGLYFAVLEHEGSTRSARVVRLH